MGIDAHILPMGQHAVLVEVADSEAVVRLSAALYARRARGDGSWACIDEIVPAARTVLVRTRPHTQLGVLAGDLSDLADSLDLVAAQGMSPADRIELPVIYDGPDLADIARHTGLTETEVVAAHTGMPWHVAFAGFAPGFAYLIGGDPRLQVPRRREPRAAVPAGSVALAGAYSGIYPRVSPGGWQLIGSTEVALWDVERDPPALLRPGVTVAFVDAEAS